MGKVNTVRAVSCVSLALLLYAGVLLLAGCGGEAAGLKAEAPAGPEVVTAWPDALPVDKAQPWEERDAYGRVASAINAQSEFCAGVERYSDSGAGVTDNGEAANLQSGSAGAKQLGWAIYRLTMSGAQPGVVSADVNLLEADGGGPSEYYLGLANYTRGCWDWRGPFSDSHVRLSLAQEAKAGTDHLSPLGNLFICVAAYNGAKCDVVAVAANPLDGADTTPPPAPTGLTATALSGALDLSWTAPLAGDLAGYRVYYAGDTFSLSTEPGVKALPYLLGQTRFILSELTAETYVRITAVDISGNESPLSTTASAMPLAGSAAPVQLTASAPSGMLNDSITLTASGAASYDWDLDGDGLYDVTGDATGTQQADTGATGIIRPMVRGGDGGTAIACGAVSLIIVANTRPVASATASPQSGTAPLSVTFTGTAQDAEDEPAALTYAWDFDGDGTYEAGTNSQTPDPHLYSSSGVFNAKFRVTDSQGAWDVDTVTVVVSADPSGNNPPSAVLTPEGLSGTSPLTVEFDASGSDAGGDPGDSIVQYDWDWDGDGSYDAFGTAPTISHTYSSSGSYTARMRVTDKAGNQATATSSISVNAAPQASLTATPQSGVPGETVLLSASGSTDADGSIAQFEWDLDGNGSYETNTGTADCSLKVLPGTPGHYAVGLRVTDDDGATDSASLILTAEGWANANPNPDSAGITGLYTSLAVVNGKPAISYFDNSTYHLRYVQADSSDGSTWTTPITVDSTDGVGYYPSLTVVNGRPAISYYDDLNDDLRYVRASDSDGSAWDTPVTVDSENTTGETASLAVVNGRPAISYLYSTGGDLRYVRASDADGSAWEAPLTLDSAGVTGAHSSLAMVNGKPAISYLNISSGILRYVHANDADGSAWAAPITIDSGGDTGWYSSLAVVNGKPAIGYCYNSSGLLRYVQAYDADGSAWAAPVNVDSSGATGYFPSLAVVNGVPAMSYWHGATSDLRYVQAYNADGSAWGAPVTLDSVGDTGWYTSLAVVDGQPGISYYDQSNGDLRYIKLY